MPAIQKNSIVTPKTTQTSTSAERKAFASSPYTVADAKVVKSKMGLSTLDAAKDVIGKAILDKKESATLGKLGVTRGLIDTQDCVDRFKRSRFSDRDVVNTQKAFDFLKGSSTKEVQAYLGLKLRNAEAGHPAGMEMLKQSGIGWLETSARDNLNEFKAAGLTDRHVRTAKEKYDFLKNTPDTEVKEYLGLKIKNGRDNNHHFAQELLGNIGASRGWVR